MLYIFEGVNGVGKTYHLNKLKSTLESNHIKVKTFQTTKDFPHLTSLALTNSKLSNIEKTLMFITAQYSLLNNFIIPAINDNYIVLCDRLWLSTLIYHEDTFKAHPFLKNYIHCPLNNGKIEYNYIVLIDSPQNILTKLKNRNNLDFSNNSQYVEYKNNLDKTINLEYIETLQNKYINSIQDFKTLKNVNIIIKNLKNES